MRDVARGVHAIAVAARILGKRCLAGLPAARHHGQRRFTRPRHPSGSSVATGPRASAGARRRAYTKQSSSSPPRPCHGADRRGVRQEIGERLFELLLTDYLAAEQPSAFNISLDAQRHHGGDHRRRRRRARTICAAISAGRSCPRSSAIRPDFPRASTAGAARLRSTICPAATWPRRRLALGLPVAYPAKRLEALSGSSARPTSSPPPTGRSLVLPFFYANVAGNTIEGGAGVAAPSATGRHAAGTHSRAAPAVAVAARIDLAPSAKLTLRAGTNLGELFGVALTPPDDVGIRYPFAPARRHPQPASGRLHLPPDTPVILLGDPAASRSSSPRPRSVSAPTSPAARVDSASARICKGSSW